MKNPSNRAEKIFFAPLKKQSHKDILENIIKNIHKTRVCVTIQSINPEIIEIARSDSDFAEIIRTSQMHIVDGVGIAAAARLLHIEVSERYTGVDLVHDVLTLPRFRSFRIMLIGGKGNVAERLADCYRGDRPASFLQGYSGISNISHPDPKEEEKLLSIVADAKPHIIFFAFGSPYQEKWIYAHRAQLKGIVCAGVGGSFDFLAGDVPRAPRFVRSLGLEWLFRLLRQPWRWKRQLRLVSYFMYILRARMSAIYGK